MENKTIKCDKDKYDKGICEWCNICMKEFIEVTVEHTWMDRDNVIKRIKANYCPACGRKLKLE